MINFFLSFFSVGYIKYAPGTIASILAAFIWFLLPTSYSQQILIILILSVLGFLFCYKISKKIKESDPSYIVIDEVVGTFLSLLFLPKVISFYIISLFIFRFFDILKPSIIFHSEKIKNGVGIMLDDIISGFLTFLIIHILIY